MNKRCFLVFALLVTLTAYLPISDKHVEAQTDQRSLRVKSSESVTKWPMSAKRFALVIGVDDYDDTQITKLEGASNDAKATAQALIQYAGFRADQVILLSSGEPKERTPTRGNILRRLSNLRAAVPKDGLLLFAFAGHGMNRDGFAYLLPADAQVSGDITLLEDTAINVEVIRDRIRQSGIEQVVIILDSCRDNPVGRGSDDNVMTEPFAHGFNFDVQNREVKAFATFYASEVGHRAYEDKEKQQGYFTFSLVEGLRGAAANQNGEVTLGGLRKYLEEEVARRSVLDLGAQKKQRPFAVIEGYRPDELIIAKVAAKPTNTEGRSSLTHSELVRRVSPSVVYIHVRCRLIDKETGSQVYHAHREGVPLYRTAKNGTLEPVLSLAAKGNTPMGLSKSGSGVVVTTDGFIFTSRNLAVAWYGPYPSSLFRPGFVVDHKFNVIGKADSDQLPTNWIPARFDERLVPGERQISGRNEELEVTLPGKKRSMPGKLARVNDISDVAMIKVDPQEPLSSGQLSTAEIQPGDPVTIVGYLSTGQSTASSGGGWEPSD
jgi:hypothetical protein